MNGKQIFIWITRFGVLLFLFYLFFIIGTLAIHGAVPDVPSEPGLLPNDLGLLVIGISNTLLIIALILSSRWNGLKLIFGLVLAYYGAVTFLTQIETWYFLSKITVDEGLLVRLLIMGLPTAFLYIPIAVCILGKGRIKEKGKIDFKLAAVMPIKQWVWKLMIIALIYVILYWTAGYFIAWQNPVLRTFYGSSGDIVPFWEHTVNTLITEPGLFPFQFLRGILWSLCALPVILGSKINVVWTSILLGLFFTIPQCLGLLIANPLMPNASVRYSHLIEVGTSNFVMALLIVWLFHREHKSLRDFLNITIK